MKTKWLLTTAFVLLSTNAVVLLDRQERPDEPVETVAAVLTIPSITTTSTTTTALPATTTTTPPPPTTAAPRPTPPPRASRSLQKAVPVAHTPPPAPVTPTVHPYPEGCRGHGYKTREQARHCWDRLLFYIDGDHAKPRRWDVGRAFNIMYCESKGDPWAKNPRSSATGLFQILGGSTDPVSNVNQAYVMWQQRGWQPWVCKG